MRAAQILELREHEPRRFDRNELPDPVALTLSREHRRQVRVAFPSPETDGLWELTPQGWVGYLPLGHGLALRLSSKVEIANLFRMLEYAYRLEDLELSGLADCAVLEDLFERLANILALRVLQRGRRGFHRDYLGRNERLPYLRGRLDLPAALRRPWSPRLDCQFQEHTADVDDNRLLAWTLSRLACSGACREEAVRTNLVRAVRELRTVATPQPFVAADCLGRSYTRLNEDYRLLHALCRFFLEGSGPAQHAGGHRNLPFLVSMDRLFELFASEWLRTHLPPEIEVNVQHRVPLASGLEFRVDLVLAQRASGRPLLVLDTKYKRGTRPAAADVAQVVAYAHALDAPEAVLLYPEESPEPLDFQVGKVRVRRLAFDLGGDLEAAGRRLRHHLLAPGGALLGFGNEGGPRHRASFSGSDRSA